MDNKEWLYMQNGKQQGPVSDSELRRLAATGELQPCDLLWKTGMPQWVPATSFHRLFPQPAIPSRAPTQATEPKKRTPPPPSGNLAKLLVWVAVFLWCLLPFFWLGVTFITNLSAKETSSYPSSIHDTSEGPSLGALIGFGGGGCLMVALSYGVWCAVGVVCGFGVERALSTTVEVVAQFKKTKEA